MTYPIAYQLYSSRNFPPLFAQFGELKAMGYDAIEPWLPAYEGNPKLFRKQLDESDLKCFGFHMPLDGLVSEPNRFIEIALELGAKYMIPPWIAPERRVQSADFWKGIGEDLATGAQKAAKHDLEVAWHNHDFEYHTLADGTRPIDHLLGTSQTVKFEIDCGWITRAGANPDFELKQYATQIIAIQVKDTAPLGTKEDDGWTATGDGIIDWPVLFKIFHTTNTHHVVAEHDNPADWKLFAQRSVNYIRALNGRSSCRDLLQIAQRDPVIL